MIREMRLSDILQLTELVFRYKLETAPDFPDSQKEVIRGALLGSMECPDSRAFVYENEDGMLGGYTVFHIVHYPMIAGQEVYISDLLIMEDSRGKGVGGSLLKKAEEFAKEHRCVRIMLNNPKEFKSYRREFYKKHGYTERVKFANFVKMVE